MVASTAPLFGYSQAERNPRCASISAVFIYNFSSGLINHLRDRPDYFAQLSDQTRRWIVQHVRLHSLPHKNASHGSTQFSLVYRELYTSAYAAGPVIRTQSWHLGFIGVLPQLQRRGLGRALVNAVIGNVSVHRVPVNGSLISVGRSCGISSDGRCVCVVRGQFLSEAVLQHDVIFTF